MRSYSPKGDLIWESSSLWPKSQRQVPNHYPEYLVFRWIVIRIVIWHLSFWRSGPKWKTHWDSATFTPVWKMKETVMSLQNMPKMMMQCSVKNQVVIKLGIFGLLFCVKKFPSNNSNSVKGLLLCRKHKEVRYYFNITTLSIGI